MNAEVVTIGEAMVALYPSQHTSLGEAVTFLFEAGLLAGQSRAFQRQVDFLAAEVFPIADFQILKLLPQVGGGFVQHFPIDRLPDFGAAQAVGQV